VRKKRVALVIRLRYVSVRKHGDKRERHQFALVPLYILPRHHGRAAEREGGTREPSLI
jgi:hypothetical protein